MLRGVISLFSLAYSSGKSRREFLELTFSDLHYANEHGISMNRIFFGAFVQAAKEMISNPSRVVALHVTFVAAIFGLFNLSSLDSSTVIVLFLPMMVFSLGLQLVLLNYPKTRAKNFVYAATYSWTFMIYILSSEQSARCIDCATGSFHPIFFSYNIGVYMLMLFMVFVFVSLSGLTIWKLYSQRLRVLSMLVLGSLSIELVFMSQLLARSNYFRGLFQDLTINSALPQSIAICIYLAIACWFLLSSVYLFTMYLRSKPREVRS